MSPVAGREFGFLQSLDDREDGGIDEPDVGVRIPVAQLTDPRVVSSGDVRDDVRAGFDIGVLS